MNLNKLIIAAGLIIAWYFIVNSINTGSQFLNILVVGLVTIFAGLLEIGTLVGGKK